MPSPNAVKTYISGGIYHVYNRGVEQRRVFETQADYLRFMYYFEAFLGNQVILNSVGQPYKKFNSEIALLSYCLMPNHIHMQLQQKSERGLVSFMQSLMTGYTMYFNLKYRRVGSLFQGTYKGRLSDEDAQVIETSRYIHRNPDQLDMQKCLDYPYSSLHNYAVGIYPTWLTPTTINNYFYSSADYINFCSRKTNPEVKPLDLRLSYQKR